MGIINQLITGGAPPCWLGSFRLAITDKESMRKNMRQLKKRFF